MFPVLCLVTFGVFSSYWLTSSLCKKTITAIKRSSMKSSPSQEATIQSGPYEQNKQQDLEGPYKIVIPASVRSQQQLQPVSKLTSASTNPPSELMNLAQSPNVLRVQSSCENDDHSNVSASNQLNVAMIQDTSYNADTRSAEKQALSEVIQSVHTEEEGAREMEAQTKNQQAYFIAEQQRQRKQHSELQIIQALGSGPVNFSPNNHEQILPNTAERKQSESDTVIVKLIQQIDQLFLNNQQQFMNVIGKYKVQEARYGHHCQGEAEQQILRDKEQLKVRVAKLEGDLGKKIQEMDMMEIQLTEYKSATEGFEKEIGERKRLVYNLEEQNKKLQEKLTKLTQQNSKFSESVGQLQNQIKQLQNKNKQISKLQNNFKAINQKNILLEQNLATEIARKQSISKQYTQLKKDFDYNLNVINNLKQEVQRLNQKLRQQEPKEEVKISQKDYMEKLKQFQQEIQRIRNEATQEKKKYDELLARTTQEADKNQYAPMSTHQNLGQSNMTLNGNKNTEEEKKQLQKINENLKNEIQFAQTQIRMFEQTEAAYIKQIQELERQVSSGPTVQVMQLRAKISKLQPIVNEYDIMQRRYFQIKLKYEKLVHQRPQLNHSGKREQGASQIVMPTSPKVNRYPSGIMNVTDSPSSAISNDKKNNQTVGHYRFLFDCEFIGLQDREFVYETIRALLKGVLKTEKIYNSKTNRGKNPHEFIDNIRGVLVLIQLQNSKILGAYTHEAFSSLHPQSSSDNIAFILDISNRKSFANQSGLNSISYNSGSLVWGFNEIMLKFEEPEVMYTNFCRNHNIYWDGKHKIEEFIGCDKQWARIHQYQLFRVSKI